jgi:NitT/TauT family transport system substrate-binding protein
MSIADVSPVPMPASDAGTALIAGRVPVAVTYEPYLTTARNQNKDIKLLFTAGEDPGLVSDVLVIRDDVLQSKPGQVLALVQTWNAALDRYKADTKAGQDIIAKSVGSSLDELATAFDGVRYYSLAENKRALEGDFAKKTFVDVMHAAQKAGLLQKDVSAAELIDPRFVAAAK